MNIEFMRKRLGCVRGGKEYIKGVAKEKLFLYLTIYCIQRLKMLYFF